MKRKWELKLKKLSIAESSGWTNGMYGIIKRIGRTLTSQSEGEIKPYWITGFTESDGSFMISVVKKKGGLGVDVVPTFAISQKKSEIEVLKKIKEYWGVGYISTGRSECNLIVKRKSQIREVIIPHFERYELRGEKRMKFEKFKRAWGLVEKGENKRLEGLGRILNLTLRMNSDQYSLRREELMRKLGICVEREKGVEIRLEKREDSLDPDYVSGLIDGDGSFYVSIREGKKLKPGFSVVQKGDDGEELLKLLKKNFKGVGEVYRYSEIVRYIVSSVSELLREVIPHFKEYPVKTRKEKELRKMEKICKKLKEERWDEEGIRELVRELKKSRSEE